MKLRRTLGIGVLILGLHTLCATAQSTFTSVVFKPATVLTATNQTSTAIALGTQSSLIYKSYSVGNITLTGSSLTTATFGVLGSSDGGVTYFPVAINAVATPGTTATTLTATANGLYQVNLAGLTHIKFVTSGTFTATNISLLLIASPNSTIGRASGAGGGATIDHTTNLIKGDDAGDGVDSGIAASNVPLLNAASTATVPGNSFSATPGGIAPAMYIDASPGTTQPTFNSSGSGLVVHGPGGSFLCGLDVFEGTTESFSMCNGGITITGGIDASGASFFFGGLLSTTVTLQGVAPTVTANQVGYGSQVAAASNCNQGGVLTDVAGCLLINVAGTVRYMPFF